MRSANETHLERFGGERRVEGLVRLFGGRREGGRGDLDEGGSGGGVVPSDSFKVLGVDGAARRSASRQANGEVERAYSQQTGHLRHLVPSASAR